MVREASVQTFYGEIEAWRVFADSDATVVPVDAPLRNDEAEMGAHGQGTANDAIMIALSARA